MLELINNNIGCVYKEYITMLTDLKQTSMDETVKTEISDDMSLIEDEGIEADFTEVSDEVAEDENKKQGNK